MGTLNKQQLRASGPGPGIQLVIAGAGTGKTLTLVEKLKNLICTGGYKPENLLVLTFSKKAAEEIRERVRSAIGDRAAFIASGTFHSVALNILRENHEAFLGISGFSRFPAIMEESDRTRRLESIIMSRIKSFLGFPVPVILHILNSGHRLEPPIQKKLARSGLTQAVEKVLDDYQSMKSSEHLIDFDDMVRWCILILKNNPEVRRAIHEKFSYILVDEFQDTAPDNFEFIRLLMQGIAPNLFAVGDDWQSIYGFRNARVEYIVRFKKFFPRGKVYPLTVNYRSKHEIIALSNRFIKKNRHRTSKKLSSQRGTGGKIAYHMVDGNNEEVELIKNILLQHSGNDDNVTSRAILYRNNRQGDYIRRMLDEAGTDYTGVTLMTIHASKGLEFDMVIIAGVSDMIIPDHSSDIEEERRLMYVALTRARDTLHIIFHKNEDGTPPRFAHELRPWSA